MIVYHSTATTHTQLSVLSLCCKVQHDTAVPDLLVCVEGGENEAWHKTWANNLHQECRNTALALSTTVVYCTPTQAAKLLGHVNKD